MEFFLVAVQACNRTKAGTICELKAQLKTSSVFELLRKICSTLR